MPRGFRLFLRLQHGFQREETRYRCWDILFTSCSGKNGPFLDKSTSLNAAVRVSVTVDVVTPASAFNVTQNNKPSFTDKITSALLAQLNLVSNIIHVTNVVYVLKTVIK